ncbi:DNA polymerase III subunit alpha [Dactylosporangium matsuzakiense]|uniref:DNA polymerase III subunit alpha n=1 Tax=Dactylosporangium matsuzakiense TaxID=53360 RepID=A0A9W6NIV4_9ACTN|nr:DNA polymerase III subunit alpha [Dactylosporangium matsuzakiense]UWZ47198.1 DNA polymerase III subunit alpha [Dactylosporangium matsuzakiense]GLK98360.1 DNA polymerase III subunit alpha [Dactylosporangium matsuzakiense]
MADSFVHLHVHTEYSMLDGAARLKEMFAEANRLGMPAVAITDHGNMHGAYDFYKQAKGAGVTPILGVEAYVAPESRLHKQRVKWGRPDQKNDDVSGSGGYTHKTIWARNKTGLHNLFRLNSRASIEGHFVKWPRMDAEIIAEHAEGLMATTGCPSGEVQTRLRLDQFDEALKAAAKYQDIFGKEHYFLEVMDHGLDIERRVREGLTEISKRLNIPPVVTNDSHYTHQAQAEAHDVLLCVQTAANINDPNRFRFGGSGYYLKSADEMRAVDTSELWQAGCKNTLLVAEKVDTAGMFEFHNLMPRFPVPEGETEESFFRAEVARGMARRFPNGVDEVHQKQADYETDIILSMGFPAYFLVVSDFIMWAKNEGIAVGPGRGSAAGSLVAYAMGITDLDPLPHGLIFERFLNPDRVSMPDIDIDFDERRRGDVIRYVTEKWGDDRVAQIATFGTIKAKAAIKDSARVLGYPFAVGDKITKAMPPAVMGKDIPLSGIFDPNHPRYSEAVEFRALYDSDPDVKKVVETAKGLEGLIRQTGVHAAGVIMSAEPLIDHVPLMRRDADGAIITQFDYPTCETLGLLKMDFLGLRNLTIIDDAVKNIKRRGIELDLLSLELDDKPAYELLARGDTLGVFQLDGGPMRSLLRLMKPDNFEDISAVLALYRPGPMGANSHTNYALRKNGQQDITPIHPELEEPLKEILGPTYGLIVYQEQVQRAAQKLAGYTLGQADLLRRAMGKKKKEVLEKEYIPFRDGMRANGYSDEAIKSLWDVLVPFADYAFNKAHTAGYGLVSYWTAYLKANYPAEYMAALLTSVGDDKDKMAMYLAECRRMGIEVLPPDVNESIGPFAPVGSNIRFGLAAVRNVGHNVVDAIVRCRQTANGLYKDFDDFLSKVDAVACNKKTIESLIKAGAFDSMKHPRRGLLAIHADAIDNYADLKKNEAIGQFDLFGDLLGGDDAAPGGGTAMAVQIPDIEWDKRELLTFEREMLGLYVSDHPLFGLESVLSKAADTEISRLSEEGAIADGTVVTLAGMLTGVQRRITKQGKPWASASLEDLGGAVEALFFPNTYELVGQYIAEDAIVVVKGRVDRRDETPRLMAMDLSIPDVSTADENRPVVLSLPATRCTPPLVDRLKEILVNHPGKAEVHVKLLNGSKVTLLRLGPYHVNNTTALKGDLKALLGPNSFS